MMDGSKGSGRWWMVVRDVGEEEVEVLTTEVDEDEEAIEKKKKDVCHNGSDTM